MKKFTLLFATLLAMFGDAFGQKEGKVLWEKKVDELDTKNMDTFFYRTSIFASPNGNLLLSSGYYVYASNTTSGVYKYYTNSYNKNGESLWVDTDYLKQGTQTGKDYRKKNDYFVLSNSKGLQDSAFIFNENFEFVKALDTRPVSNAYLLDLEDGVLHNDAQNRLVKYDVKGNEEWVFQNQEKNVILNAQAPYFGLLGDKEEHQILILDNKGQKKGITTPQTFNRIFPTKDKGFWLENKDLEYIKFDSTGKQTTNSKFKNKISLRSFTDKRVFGDNSILFAHITADYRLNFTKISKTGDTLIISKDLSNSIKNKELGVFDFEISNEGKIVYFIEYSIGVSTEGKKNIIIGSEDMNDTKLSWSKDINLNKFIIRKGFILNQNQFQITTTNTDHVASQIYHYGFDGNLKWQYEVNNFFDSFYHKNVMYISTGDDGKFYKIDLITGKLFWKISNFQISDLGFHLKVDENGKEFMLGRVCENNQCISKLRTLNVDGSTQSEYTYPSLVFGTSAFALGNDGSVISASTEFQLYKNSFTFMLRKIKFCNDLLATATASATEACPTEKVKLSVPKQDGVTYQWQKDGKDIPNYKDAVYDFGESGTYTVTVKDETCQNQAVSNALKITIRSLASTEITTPKTTFCEGEKTTIASKTNGTFFQWQKDGKDIPNATTGIYEVSQMGDYRVGVRDDKCPQLGYSNIITMNVKPSPEAAISTDIKSVIYEPFKVKMTANVGTDLSYEWYKNDSLIRNATTSIYEADKSGTYQVKVSKDGCVKLSEPFKISILIPLANEGEVGEESVLIYPNPSKDAFHIVLPTSLKNGDVQLFDSYGREHLLDYVNETVAIRGFQQGVYFLRVSKHDRSVTSKIVIE